MQILTGAQATEASFRELAPGYRYLHLATHGFFAPPEKQSALQADQTDRKFASFRQQRDEMIRGFSPGLLSGLALAGANREPTADADDGILTADEIAFLPLDGVELVVLSACETGLGEVAGGEGLIGIQRAFQVAGARTTVASLWKVPDQATKVLMQRFYENLWQKKLTRLDALREAQLWLLNHPAQALGREASRGDRRIGAPQKAAADRLPPRYWAAFVLSGDWR